MYAVLLTALAFAMATFSAVQAQTWAPWHQPSFFDGQRGGPRSRIVVPSERDRDGRRRSHSHDDDDDDDDDDDRSRRRSADPGPGRGAEGPAVLDGGPRPAISPASPQSVRLSTGHAPGTIVIDTSARRLYLVESGSTALSYPISVGRIGFTWTGVERISRMADWPDWRPPAEMRERQPGLPELMTGGVRNPMGAKALYLGNSLYRIHGTNSAQSIGQANSSGCFRMTNSHVVDLASRVRVGTMVVVKSRL